jgi:precorrin isomerase
VQDIILDAFERAVAAVDAAKRLPANAPSAPDATSMRIGTDRNPIALAGQAETEAAPLKNASKSALIRSALVVGMPCGRPE